MQATSSSVLQSKYHSLHVKLHIVHPLFADKERQRQETYSHWDAATEADGPTLPGFGIFSLLITLVFLPPPHPFWCHLHPPLFLWLPCYFLSSASLGRNACDALVLIKIECHGTTQSDGGTGPSIIRLLWISLHDSGVSHYCSYYGKLLREPVHWHVGHTGKSPKAVHHTCCCCCGEEPTTRNRP